MKDPMKSQNRLPQRREPFSWAKKMFNDMENMMNNFGWSHWGNMWEEMNEQLKVEETESEYIISVKMQGIEDPQDVHYQYKNGVLYLQRSIEMQSKKNVDQGMMWQSHYEYFSRSIPLPKAIQWQKREVKAGKGLWQMRIPKG
jgi:HSP20 family molecular chaperone IbpA